MGVYVKGWQIPEDCRECPFQDYNNVTGVTQCQACGKPLAEQFRALSFEGKAECCPLQEVAVPHGRLIDADTLECDSDWSDYDDGYTSYSQLEIDCTTTVIEAEKGD